MSSTSTPVLPAFSEAQLDTYAYPVVATATTVYGSNVTAAWRYATGQGVSVAVIDDGFTPAVDSNFNTSLSQSFGASGIGEPTGDFHGTTTSSLIGGTGGNLPVGVAPNATVIGLKVDFGASTPMTEFVNALTTGAADASVVNNSWGFSGFGVGAATNPTYTAWYTALQNAVSKDRDGLGSVVVFASGNDRADNNNVGLQPITDNPEVIAVAATNANGTVASYSTGGAGLLVSAIGSNVAVALPQTGYYALASGTSYAAPTVSAISALMLQVNPKLGWRDVQEILADSAYAPAPSAAGFTTNDASGVNGGGMHFSNDLGFGVVDANVAVALAADWTEQSTSANEMTTTTASTRTVSVPVNGEGVSTVTETGNIRVQHVEVKINDVNLPVATTELVLISPDGTRSVLTDNTGNVGGVDETDGLDLSGSVIDSNAFWGENAAGTWTLEAIDSSGKAAGLVSSWSLTVDGDNAATVATPVVFTPEFASEAAGDAARTVVAPLNADCKQIDLAALPGASYINLNGGAGVIDGVVVSVKAGFNTVDATGCTGAVTVITGTGGSTVNGGAGSLSVLGSGGSDVVNAGISTATIWARNDVKMSFYAGGNAATVYAGSGETDITASTGALQLVVQNGAAGGITKLSDFVAGLDTVHLLGFAATAAATAFAGQTSDGHGGTLMTLTDGSRIDFLGLAHVNQSVFV